MAALNKGEAESGRRIDSAYVGLSGLYIQARNLHGSTSILPAGREVQSEDVAHAIAAARAALWDEGPRELVHLIPRGNTLDGQEGIHNPLGMIGRELWVEAHTVAGTSSHIANLVKCLREACIEPGDLVAGPLAAAEGVIQTYPDESSPLVVDLDTETLSLAIYDDGAIWHSEIRPLGSDDLTRDIAIALRLPLEAAEAVKLSGLASLFEELLQIPVQIGRPQGIAGLQAHLAQPQFASAAGLLLWGARQRQRQMQPQKSGKRRVLLPQLVDGARRLIPSFLL